MKKQQKYWVLPVVIQVQNGSCDRINNNYLLIVDVGASSTIKSAALVLMDGSGLAWRVPTGCDEEVSLDEPPAMRRRHRSDKTGLMKKVSIRDGVLDSPSLVWAAVAILGAVAAADVPILLFLYSEKLY